MNIRDFKNLAGIFHSPNTKALGKFEFNCLMSSTNSQMISKDIRPGYQLFQINPMREVFAKGKISTVQISVFKVTALIKLVIFQSHTFK